MRKLSISNKVITFESAHLRFNISWNCQVNENNTFLQFQILKQLLAQSEVRTCRGADHKIALWQIVHSFAIINSFTSKWNTSPFRCDTDARLQSHLHRLSIRAWAATFPISPFPITMQTLSCTAIALSVKHFYRLMDHRRISMRKWHLCFNLFSCCHSHSKKHLKGSICCKMLSGNSQCIFYLSKDLIFIQVSGISDRMQGKTDVPQQHGLHAL